MIDKFEFNDTKQLRKSLLISSFVGIFFNSLVKYSTGNIMFLGFKIPVEDATIIPELIGYLIVYFMIALTIKFNDEKYKQKHLEYSEYNNLQSDKRKEDYLSAKFGLKEKGYFKILFIKGGNLLLDIIFPISFSVFTLFKIF